MVMVTDMTTLVMAVAMLIPVDTAAGMGTVVDTKDMEVVVVVTSAVDLEEVVVVTLAVDLVEEVVVTLAVDTAVQVVGTKMKMALYSLVKQ
jgi:hypothetical protein